MVKKEKRVTLTDIATAMGISRAAVGKVLGSGGNNNIRVSEEKTIQIREMASKLHYIPNFNARALTGSRTRVIGVLLDTQAPALFFRLIAEMERLAADIGYRFIIGEAHDNLYNLYENCRHLRQYGVDCIVCVSHDYPQEKGSFEKIFSDPFPMVLVNGPLRGDYPQVLMDYDVGISEAEAELHRKGRTRTAMLFCSHDHLSYSISARKRAFSRYFPARGCKQIELRSRIDDADGIRRELADFVSQTLCTGEYDSVILENDRMALALEGEMLKRGLSIPQTASLIGFDDDISGRFAPISLSTIAPPITRMSKAIIDLVCKEIEGTVRPEERVISIGNRLLIRDSI